MDFKGMLVSVGFSMAKIPIPPLMLLGKMTGVSNRLLTVMVGICIGGS